MSETSSALSDAIKDAIKTRIITMTSDLSKAMGNDHIEITAEISFFGDLGFTKTILRELWKPLTKISKDFEGTRILKDEAGKMKKVEDAIKLVISKIED